MLLLLLALATITATVRHGEVVVQNGNASRTVTNGGGWSDPAVSPDETTVAMIHADDDRGEHGHSSLWIASATAGAPRRVLAGRESNQAERKLALLSNPHWSLDGRSIYVDADAWVTSSAIHRVDVATGAERFVVDGWSFGVIRSGRWAGHLLVGQHSYYPRGGSYNPVSVVSPAGRVLFRIPGSAADEGERSVPRWLSAQRTTAS